MKVVSFMRDLVSKGMSWEDAAMFAERFEEGVEEAIERVRPQRSSNAERQARFRERRKNPVTNNVTRNATDNAEDVSPTPPSENTPFPPLKGGTSPKISASPLEKPKLKPLSAWVAEIWEITPRPGRERSGRPALERSLKAAERRGSDLAAVKAGVEGYYASEDATKNHGQYAQGVHVVVSSGRWEAFAADAEEAAKPVETDPWPARLLRWRTAAYWNSEWGPKPGKPGYRGPEAEGLAA